MQAIRLDLVFKIRPALSSLMESIIHLENNLLEFDRVNKMRHSDKVECFNSIREVKGTYFKLSRLIASTRTFVENILSIDKLSHEEIYENHQSLNQEFIYHIRTHASIIMGYISLFRLIIEEFEYSSQTYQFDKNIEEAAAQGETIFTILDDIYVNWKKISDILSK